MFRLSDFLIYCFITAYSPGANNLLSMSNAMRLGFSRSIRFNFGITAGFSIVMALCTIFSAALYSLLPKAHRQPQYWHIGYPGDQIQKKLAGSQRFHDVTHRLNPEKQKSECKNSLTDVLCAL